MGTRAWTDRFVIATVVLTFAAVVLLTIGIVGFVSVGSEADEEKAIAAERSELASSQEGLEQDLVNVKEQTEGLYGAVSTIDTELEALVLNGNRFTDARNSLTDVYGAAVDRGNAGDLSGERAMFENDSRQPLANMEAALTLSQEALPALQAAFRTLEESLP